MDKVNIFLIENSGQSPFLSIPKGDIQRLTLSPHKWLRFVMFTICGAHGVLSVMPQGPPVDDNTRFTDICDAYYYTPDASTDTSPCFIDYNVLNEKVTQSAHTSHAVAFLHHVMERDGCFCVVTKESIAACDAAHIIPKCKGSLYMQCVVESRHHLYPSTETDISDIDDVRNGILLRVDLHRKLSHGTVAFLKTPNFVLNCDDIPSEGVQVYQDLPHRITMQHLVPDTSLRPVHDLDAHLIGTKETLPPAIILDFIYGAAAYQCWKTRKNVHEQLQTYYSSHYKPILDLRPPEDILSDSESGDGSHEMCQEMLGAMDEMNLIMMKIHGTTPEEVAMKTQKKLEEEQLKEQKTSQMKVLEWMESSISDTI